MNIIIGFYEGMEPRVDRTKTVFRNTIEILNAPETSHGRVKSVKESLKGRIIPWDSVLCCWNSPVVAAKTFWELVHGIFNE